MSDLPEEPSILSFSVLQERRRGRGKCDHRRFEIDADAGAVFCADCSEEVPAFQALLVITRRDSLFFNQRDALKRQIEELKNYKPWLKVVRELERIWRGKTMLPCCPHCRKGIKAQDMAYLTCVNVNYEAMMQKATAKLAIVKPEAAE